MTKDEILIEAFRGNLKQDNLPSIIQGVVAEVGENSCKVKLISNDLKLEDVLYTATQGNTNGFFSIPKEGTNVLIAPIGGDENSLYLLAMDEITQVRLVLEDETITIDKEGFKTELSKGKLIFKNENSDLKTLITDLVDMVTQLTLSTAVGPSGTPLPPTISKADEIKQSINGLFK